MQKYKIIQYMTTESTFSLPEEEKNFLTPVSMFLAVHDGLKLFEIVLECLMIRGFDN